MDGQILVVDDEKEIADLIDFYLSSEGFKVLKCYTAADAVRLIETEKIELAVLDIMLPGTNGFELCKIIRKTNFYPIIMLTAKDAEIDKITGLSLGADDYVTKPFLPLELVARVKAQLRRYQRYDSGKDAASKDAPDLLICADITLNLQAHQCFLKDREISLTPTEFLILKVLFEHRGKVISSEELFHAVWEDEYYSKGNNTISVHIRHLREKLGDTADKPKYIKTIWGVGYKVNA